MSDKTPIAVDLDGSLIQTDMLLETFVRAFFRKPWLIFFVFLWLLKGKAHLKSQLAGEAKADVSLLPYNSELLDYLRGRKDQGQPLVLCTATNQAVAEEIASHLGIFSETIGSSDQHNLSGKNKAEALSKRFGERGFIYVGNEVKDLKVWSRASGAVVVGSNSLVKKASRVCPVEKQIDSPGLKLPVFLKAIRIHQWVKNSLLFVPLITSHQFTNLPLVFSCFLAFLAFGLCASATYLINDMSDLDSDRKHWKKHKRPLASGTLSIKTAFLLVFAMLSTAAALALLVNLYFFLVLIAYTAVTLTYSFVLKRLQTIDIITLAGLYTLRIIAGGAAIELVPSFWLMALSMFVFFTLAIVKRISELINKGEESGNEKLSGRGYFFSDVDVLTSLASSSAMVAVLVFAMYINSDDVIILYDFPMALWAICPILAYWLARMLVMSSRGEVDEDPIVFALKDTRSWIAGLAITLAIYLAL